MIDPETILAKHYDTRSPLYRLVLAHSRAVARKALDLARSNPGLGADESLVCLGGMLHDIGVFLTHAPKIGCTGAHPYICHGLLGREILDREGLPEAALICERHVGAGLSRKDIEAQQLPLPARDMIPVSPEEILVCVADKFFSKSTGMDQREHSLEKVRRSIARHGEKPLKRLETWLEMLRIG